MPLCVRLDTSVLAILAGAREVSVPPAQLNRALLLDWWKSCRLQCVSSCGLGKYTGWGDVSPLSPPIWSPEALSLQARHDICEGDIQSLCMLLFRTFSSLS